MNNLRLHYMHIIQKDLVDKLQVLYISKIPKVTHVTVHATVNSKSFYLWLWTSVAMELLTGQKAFFFI